MAVNRYSKPARSEFINTYVPIPFNEMVAAGQIQQGRYDAASAGLDEKVADAAALKAIPNTVDYQYVKGVQNTMEDVVEKYADKDLGNAVIRRQLNADIRSSIDADRLRSIQDSYSAWGQQQKHKAQLVANRRYNQFTDEDPASDPNFDSTQGVYNYLTPAYEDPRQTLEQLFNSPGYLRGRPLGKTAEGYTRQGRDKTDVDNTAESQWYDILQTPAGQDVVKIFRGQNPGDQTKDKDIIKEWIRDVGYQEYTFEGLEGSRDPVTPAGTTGGTPQSLIELTLRQQPYSETSRNYKKGVKAVVEGQKQIKELEAVVESLGVDSKQGMQVQEQIEQIKEDLAPYENVTKRLNEFYSEPYRTSIDSIYGKMGDRITSLLTQPVDAPGDGQFGLSGNFTPEEAGEISDRLSGIIEEIVQTGEGLNKFLGRGSEGLVGWKEMYKEKYGTEEFNDLMLNEPSNLRASIKDPKPENLTSIIKDAVAKRGQLLDIEKDIKKDIKEDGFGVVDKGVSESTVLLPTMDVETKTLKHWKTNKVQDSETYRVLDAVSVSPEDFKVDVVSSSDLSSKQKAKALDELKNANKVVPISINESDVEGTYLYARAYKTDKNGTNQRIENGFKVRLDRSQSYAIASDYLKTGGPEALSMVIRLTSPEIAKQVEFAFRESNKPETLPVTVMPETEPIVFELGEDGGYYVTGPDGTQYGPFNGREDIKVAAYEMLIDNARSE